MKIRFRNFVAAAAMLALAGCGFQQVQPRSSTPSHPALPTPTPLPTPVVEGGSVAAMVNGVAIPMTLFKALLRFGFQQSPGPPAEIAQGAITELIQDELVTQYAASHHITVSSSSVHKGIRTFTDELGQARIRQAGLTTADVLYLTENELLRQKIMSRIAPLQRAGPVATARHILIVPGERNACAHKVLNSAQARAFAQQLMGEIRGGKSFASLARSCSADTGSAANGGKLQGNVGGSALYPGSFVQPFDNAVFHGPVGRLQLVHSVYGYHILQVLSRRQGRYPALVAQESQSGRFQNWLTAQQKSAKVQIKERVK